jgi:hypothetical protein
LVEINCPFEFIDVMPYSSAGYIFCEYYYWIEQIDLAYSQYYGLSETNQQSWLRDKRLTLDSIMKYVNKRKRKLRRNGWYLRYHRLRLYSSPPNPIRFILPPLSPPITSPPPPPLSRFLDLSQIIQFHIQRLENHSTYQQMEIVEVDSEINCHKNDKPNNFISNAKKSKKNKRGTKIYDKCNKFNMKGKHSKNKFAHKYG